MWIEEVKYISRKEAARRTSLSIRQIDRYISDGRIKAFKPFAGRRVLIDPKSLSEESLKAVVPCYN